VTIFAASEGKVGSAAVTVRRVPVASLSLDATVLPMEPLDERTLVATPKDAAGAPIPGRAVSWGSSAALVATVANDGKVTARAVGRTTITATVDGIVATATVTVRGAPTADLLYQRSVPDTNDLYIRSFAAPGLAPTRINAGSVSHMPAASPNGARIAFAVHMVGLQGESIDDIFAVDRNGMNMRRLTTMPGWEEHPAWSPDGATIAFTHWDVTTGREDVWVMNADGSAQRNLTAGEPAARSRGEPAWSPDGQWLAYSATLGTAAPDRGSIWIMRADGSGKRLLTSSAGWDQRPTWSPDGTRIAFGRGGDLAIVGVATGLVTSLGLGQAPWYPSWSPDGEFIAFAARPVDNVFGTFSIYTVRADGSDVRLRERGTSSTLVNVVWPTWIKRLPAAAGQ
jgi:tricorn protease-like protein